MCVICHAMASAWTWSWFKKRGHVHCNIRTELRYDLSYLVTSLNGLFWKHLRPKLIGPIKLSRKTTRHLTTGQRAPPLWQKPMLLGGFATPNSSTYLRVSLLIIRRKKKYFHSLFSVFYKKSQNLFII
jgi:hypothetical protein